MSMRLLGFLLLAACTGDVLAGQPGFVLGAYKHLPMWKGGSHAITVAPDGVATRYIADGKSAFGSGGGELGFATGECGDEKWGEEDGTAIAAANVADFDRAGVDYIIFRRSS